MQVILLNTVETFLSSLSAPEIAKALRTIELLENFGSSLGMPHSRHLSGGLLELRVRGKREVRIFYSFHKNKAVLVHACIKKTQRTLDKDLRRAQIAKNNLH